MSFLFGRKFIKMLDNCPLGLFYGTQSVEVEDICDFRQIRKTKQTTSLYVWRNILPPPPETANVQIFPINVQGTLTVTRVMFEVSLK